MENNILKSEGNLIMLTTGKEDGGAKATVAFAYATTSLSMGIETKIFLTMGGTIWAYLGSGNNVQYAGFEKLSNYIDMFTELGGEILVCSPCTEYHCSVINKNAELLKNARISGFAEIVKISVNYKTLVL